jgi:hypothetical protein
MSVDPQAWPDPFYIFVNQARASAQHNYQLTRRFMSAAFTAAFGSLMPTVTMTPFISGGRRFVLLSSGETRDNQDI